VSDEFDAKTTIEVLESGPTTLPPDIFDTTGFTPLWGGDPCTNHGSNNTLINNPRDRMFTER
jgi:hypothetical protein